MTKNKENSAIPQKENRVLMGLLSSPLTECNQQFLEHRSSLAVRL
jgi:hypothetical protein